MFLFTFSTYIKFVSLDNHLTTENMLMVDWERISWVEVKEHVLWWGEGHIRGRDFTDVMGTILLILDSYNF